MARRVIRGANEVKGAGVVKIHLPPLWDAPPNIAPLRLKDLTRAIAQMPCLVIVQDTILSGGEPRMPFEMTVHFCAMVVDFARDPPRACQRVTFWYQGAMIQFGIPYGRRQSKSGFPFCDI